MTKLYTEEQVRRVAEEASASGAVAMRDEGEAHHPHIADRILATLTPVSLPVVRTCGECAHWNGAEPPHCDHPATFPDVAGEEFDPRTRASHSPPSWCPLRGAQ